MRQTLPKAFLMPERCACCLGPAEDYLDSFLTKTTWLVVISIKRTASVQIPYCGECRDHVKRTAGCRVFLMTVLVFLASSAVAGLLWGIALWLGSSSSQILVALRDVLTFVGLITPVVVPAAYVVREVVLMGRSPGPRHTRAGPSMTLVDFTDHTITLDVRNPKFLALLKVAQETAVVAFEAAIARASAPSAPAPAPAPAAMPPRLPVVAPSPSSVESAPAPTAPSTDSAKRRLAAIPRDAKPERALRFVAFKCQIELDGLVTVLADGASRKIAWSGFRAIYARRLPNEPPWERMLVMDLVPASGAPVRLLSTTVVNFAALPGGAASAHLENSRRLAAYVEQQSPEVVMDPETRSFVSGFGPCAALSGIELFIRYDDQFEDALEGFRAAGT